MFAAGRTRDARFVIIVLHARDTMARSHEIPLKNVGMLRRQSVLDIFFRLVRATRIMEFNS